MTLKRNKEYDDIKKKFNVMFKTVNYSNHLNMCKSQNNKIKYA